MKLAFLGIWIVLLFLFTEMKEAKDYIEKYELMIWFSRTSSAGVKEYSLHQLRKVKEILTS